MREFGSIVEGQQHSSGKWIDVYNPFTLEQTGRVAAIDPKAVNEIAKKMHDSDVRLSRHERHNILMKMSAEIESRSDDVSRLITDETGLARKDTRYEAQRVCDVLRFSAMAALQDDSKIFPCDISAQGRPRRIYTSRYPLRLITAITPFNHPMNQVAHKIGPAIATNNNVILKPSEKTPLSAYFLAELSIQCGLPVESLTVLNGSTKDLAKAMVTHELVDLVTFTGSSSVGRHLASLAKYKRLILELGGSSPLLVLEDADPAVAAQIAVAGIFKNSGQRCTAIRRIIVQEKIAAPFADSLKKEVALLRCGDPYDDKTDVGTVISETAARQIQARVENSLSQGSKLLIGNHREGALYHPTVLDKVNPAHDLVAQETFGPVAPIIRVDSFNEAIRLANDTCYGLSAGVVSNHWPSIQRAIGELEVGTVNINEAPSYRLETTPFGGIKASGLGYKEGVIETMKAMTYIKTYSLPWDQP